MCYRQRAWLGLTVLDLSDIIYSQSIDRCFGLEGFLLQDWAAELPVHKPRELGNTGWTGIKQATQWTVRKDRKINGLAITR